MKLIPHDYTHLKCIMMNGVKWYQFIVMYETDEGRFGFSIMATSWEHAAAMVTDIKLTAQLEGALCN